MSLIKFLVLILSPLAFTSTTASELNVVSPESVGMSSQRLQQVDHLMQRYLDQERYAGMVTMIARQGKVVYLKAMGQLGFADQRPMRTDSLFRIYSMTKPVTAVAAMMLYEQGRFRLDDPIDLYLPELAGLKVWTEKGEQKPESAITMRQLLTHTAGFTYGFFPDNPVDVAYTENNILGSESSQEFVDKLAALPLRFQPGKRYHYSVSMDLVGIIIERLSGMGLDEFFQKHIFVPLGMHDTFFNVPSNKRTRLAGDHAWNAEKNKVIAIHAAQQRDFSNRGFFSGGGGLVSTISDYMRFSQMVLNGGTYEGHRLLSPTTIRFLSLNHLSDEVRGTGVGDYPAQDLYAGQSMAFGYGVVTDAAKMPAISSMGELSWSGAAGTKFWIDPSEELIAIALVQLYQSPWPLRFDLKAATYQAIIDSDDN